jgi:hypothetical protein
LLIWRGRVSAAAGDHLARSTFRALGGGPLRGWRREACWRARLSQRAAWLLKSGPRSSANLFPLRPMGGGISGRRLRRVTIGAVLLAGSMPIHMACQHPQQYRKDRPAGSDAFSTASPSSADLITVGILMTILMTARFWPLCICHRRQPRAAKLARITPMDDAEDILADGSACRPCGGLPSARLSF